MNCDSVALILTGEPPVADSAFALYNCLISHEAIPFPFSLHCINSITLRAPHPALRTPHSALLTPHSALRTLLSALIICLSGLPDHSALVYHFFAMALAIIIIATENGQNGQLFKTDHFLPKNKKM